MNIQNIPFLLTTTRISYLLASLPTLLPSERLHNLDCYTLLSDLSDE